MLTALHSRHAAPASPSPRAPIADEYPSVTCIFADIVGWTVTAAAMAPRDTMHLLDRLFARCDSLCTQHGVYKVWSQHSSFPCAPRALITTPLG